MKEIKGKVNMLVLPVPLDSDEFFIIHEGTRVAFFLPNYKRFDLPKGNKGKHIIVGKVSNLTEEQARELVETIFVEIPPSPSNDMSGDYDIAYVDYQHRGEFAGWNGDAGAYKKAVDSFKSLLRLNECYIKDPKFKPEMNHWGATMEDYIQFAEDTEKYENTPEDYLIIKIIDEE